MFKTAHFTYFITAFKVLLNIKTIDLQVGTCESVF